jgi:hypothetical protein
MHRAKFIKIPFTSSFHRRRFLEKPIFVPNRSAVGRSAPIIGCVYISPPASGSLIGVEVVSRVVTGEGVQIDALCVSPRGRSCGRRTRRYKEFFERVPFYDGLISRLVWDSGLSTVTRIWLESMTCSSGHVVLLLSWHRHERRATYPKRMYVRKHPLSN